MATFKDLELGRLKRGCDNPPLDPNNVRPVKCESCPFGKYGEAIGSELGWEAFAQLQSNLTISAISNGNRYCHHDELEGKPSTHVCRGARDIQLQYFHLIGVISAPTDEAWKLTLQRRINHE